MWFLLVRFVWALRWRAEGCSWSAVPRGFAYVGILAEIRATEPCKHPETYGRHGSARARRWLEALAGASCTVAPQSELPRAVTAFLR